jgi:hypothetical protein
MAGAPGEDPPAPGKEPRQRASPRLPLWTIAANPPPEGRATP